ncbi:Nif3-like dinuclear metal center hexameric protein [Candidatus Woesearchaeota archaeon]|nr:Nif3-like dinuclear metal center hexameric protein [Candidatus Woesearchaeota archaeon]
MVLLKEIKQFLDRFLTDNAEDDNAVNGLQVENTGNVKKIGIAVDCCMEAFENAKKAGCDMILAHHPMYWKGTTEPITSQHYKKIKFLLDNDIALYAAHSPIDSHPTHGNGSELLKIIGAKQKESYLNWGFWGEFSQPKPLKEILEVIEKELNTKCVVWEFGPPKIKSVVAISGGGLGRTYVKPAFMKPVDLYLTGETSHGAYHKAKEHDINVICAGHYATETLGVKAIGKLLAQKFSVETEFIDLPTGL